MAMVKRASWGIGLTLCMICLLEGCYHNSRSEVSVLFKPGCLQDSVETVLSQIDSLSKPNSVPTILFIMLYDQDERCMIDFDVEAGWLSWPLKDSCATETFCLGRYKGQFVWIGGNPKYKELLSGKGLQLTKDDKHLLKQNEKLMSAEHIKLYSLHREYVFSPPDSLILLKSGH